MRRTIFVGDVHGCAAELHELLAAVAFVPGSDRLLLTGDAFSRGPDPRGVWSALQSTGAVMVLGNHDDRLLRQLRAAARGEPVPGRQPHHRVTFEALLPLAEQLQPWLESLPLCVEGRAFETETPAGPAPPLQADPASGESGQRAGLPPKDEAIQRDGFVLVHAGLNPERGLAGTERAEFLSIRTWPPTGSLEGPRWHDAMEPLAGTVVFGHDAPGGLTVKRLPGRDLPWLVGLDSGCVYGGRLSAWVLEEDHLVQVPSRQPRTPGRGPGPPA